MLLSPACASYDQFANFEARGRSFRDLVMRLPGVSTVQPKQGRAACPPGPARARALRAPVAKVAGTESRSSEATIRAHVRV